MSEPFLGEIRMFGFNFAPQGWAMCNGQLLSIAQNTALFALLGTFYGGNGTTTFALPNLQGRVPIHEGTGPGLSPYPLGQEGGSENVTLTQQQMPQHNHVVSCDGSGTARGASTPNVFGVSAGDNPIANFPGLATSPGNGVYSAGPATGQMNPAMITAAGNSQPHSNIQPYLTVNFCIALQGIFPSRN